MAEDLSFTITINDDAPEGTSLCYGFREKNAKNLLAPLCLEEALRRGALATERFSWFGCELPFMPVSTDPE